MKALIYRDILINKKSILCSLILCVGLIYILLDEMPEKMNEFVLFINVISFLCIIVVYSVADYVCSSDRNAKWEMFIKSSPIKQSVVIGEKYIFDYLFIMLGLFASLIIVLVVVTNSVYSMQFHYFIGVILAIAVALIYSAMKNLFVSILGKKKAEIVAIVFFVTLILVVSIMIVMENTNWVTVIDVDISAISDFVMSKKCLLIFLGAMTLHVCSYMVCIKLCK